MAAHRRLTHNVKFKVMQQTAQRNNLIEQCVSLYRRFGDVVVKLIANYLTDDEYDSFVCAVLGCEVRRIGNEPTYPFII